MKTRTISGSTLVGAASLVTGCATAYDSGISEKGPNAYFLQIRTPNNKGGGNESLSQGKAQAEEYCAKSGKKADITNQEVGPVTADVYFTCTAK